MSSFPYFAQQSHLGPFTQDREACVLMLSAVCGSGYSVRFFDYIFIYKSPWLGLYHPMNSFSVAAQWCCGCVSKVPSRQFLLHYTATLLIPVLQTSIIPYCSICLSSFGHPSLVLPTPCLKRTSQRKLR